MNTTRNDSPNALKDATHSTKASLRSAWQRCTSWLRRHRLAALGVVAVSMLPSCVVVVDDEPLGALSVAWTIEGFQDELDCVDYGARRVEVVAIDSVYGDVYDIAPRCDQFGATMDLEPGRYLVDVTFLDRGGYPVTFTRREPVLIIEDTELFLELDFDTRDLLF